MKTLLVYVALGVALAMTPAFGADAPAKKSSSAGKPSMLVGGRFHQVHEVQAKLECKDCHAKVQKDFLYLRKDDRMPPKMDEVGQVNRKGCVTCHVPGYVPDGVRSYWGV